MMQTAKVLKTYLSSFGLPAYTTDTVPDDVDLPYITYPLADPDWNERATFYVQLWYRTTENTALIQKADEILMDIGRCKMLPYEDEGQLLIYPENPAFQLIVDGDERSAYLNMSLVAHHLPGF